MLFFTGNIQKNIDIVQVMSSASINDLRQKPTVLGRSKVQWNHAVCQVVWNAKDRSIRSGLDSQGSHVVCNRGEVYLVYTAALSGALVHLSP